MRRFKNILAVYHDDIGADDVFTQSVALARTNGSHLTLIDVVPERYATPAGVREREKRLRKLLPAIHAEGVEHAEVKVCSGTSFIEIIKQVLRGDHDLVVTSPERMRTGLSFYLGTSAAHLIRKAPCPVWIVKPNDQGRYSRILVCVDPKSSDTGGFDLDIKLLELSTSLAETNMAELHIAHAWEVGGADQESLRSEIHDDTRHEILKKHEAVHHERVALLMDQVKFHNVEPKLHLPRSRPHDGIVDLVSDFSIDLIVMGSVNRTGISGFFIGSAAEGILASVECSVLAVKPKEFRTPVVLEEYPLKRVVSA